MHKLKVHAPRVLFPDGAIKNSPKWIKQLWNKEKWDSESNNNNKEILFYVSN